jgi:hypothetical protein
MSNEFNPKGADPENPELGEHSGKNAVRAPAVTARRSGSGLRHRLRWGRPRGR